MPRVRQTFRPTTASHMAADDRVRNAATYSFASGRMTALPGTCTLPDCHPAIQAQYPTVAARAQRVPLQVPLSFENLPTIVRERVCMYRVHRTADTWWDARGMARVYDIDTLALWLMICAMDDDAR